MGILESTVDGDTTGLENRGSARMAVRFGCSPPFCKRRAKVAALPVKQPLFVRIADSISAACTSFVV